MKRHISLIGIVLGLQGGLAQAQWEPPVGIPVPPFGIDESHDMYAGEAGYQDAGDGPYTHYVNGTNPNCSDAGSGTPAQPRCSIPTALSAGMVVEVHGGPYALGDTVFTGSGTAARPAFLRGVDDGNGFPVIDAVGDTDFTGQYLVVENMRLRQARLRTLGDASYIAVRNLEVSESPGRNGSVLGGSNIVLRDSHIHHNQGDDRHGTSVSAGAQNVWILDNYYHHNGGDAVQFCHGCSTAPPTNVYVGRNTMHSDRENGVDLKYARNVVVSQNTIHAYRSAPADTQWCFDDNSACGVFSSGSDGAGMIVGSDGAPENVWFLYNEVYDTNVGIRVEAGYDVWLIGNRLHLVANRGIGLDKTGEPLHIAHNVISGAEFGIDQNWRDNFNLRIDNNIFEGNSGAAIRLESSIVADQAVLRNNIFWNGGASVPIVWINASNVSSGNQINNLSGGSGNIVADPAFVGLGTGNLRLKDGSPGIDSGNDVLVEYDATFRQRFGGTLLRDPDGTNRPLDGDGSGGLVFDIGPYEFGGGIPPMAPTALRVD
jgi:hypothetical protein